MHVYLHMCAWKRESSTIFTAQEVSTWTLKGEFVLGVEVLGHPDRIRLYSLVYFKTNTGNSLHVPFSWSANKFPQLFGIAWTALVVLLQKQVQSFQDTLTSNQPPQKNHTTFQSSRTIEDAWLKTETVDRDVYLQVWKHDISVQWPIHLCSLKRKTYAWEGLLLPVRHVKLIVICNIFQTNTERQARTYYKSSVFFKAFFFL